MVPKQLQRQTLQKIHTGHQGIQTCRLRAKPSVWWPGISLTIDTMVKQCNICAKYQKPRSEPMLYSPLPDFPWQKVSSNLFQLNNTQHLLVVDYFSRFPGVIKLTATTTYHIMEELNPTRHSRNPCERQWSSILLKRVCRIRLPFPPRDQQSSLCLEQRTCRKGSQDSEGDKRSTHGLTKL